MVSAVEDEWKVWRMSEENMRKYELLIHTYEWVKVDQFQTLLEGIETGQHKEWS